MHPAASTLQADDQRAPDALRVLFFGPVRVQIGTDACEISCTEEMPLEDLWTKLSERFPALRQLRPTVRLARNGEFLGPNTLVRPGDEIALIPPVSGG